MEKHSVKVLTIDDDEFMRRLSNRLLTNLGYRLTKEVSGGQEALTLLKQLRVPPDVIILDLKMPGMDGIEFVRHLVQRQYPGHLILLSGQDDRLLRAAQKLVQAHQMSILGYLTKPVDPGALGALMDKLLKQLPPSPPAGAKSLTEKELHRALTQGELFCEFQPVVTLADGELASLEALVRWQHPERGLLGPDLFIGLAEDSGLIHQLTRQVIETALKQQQAWQRQGVHCNLSVNLSMENLDQLEFTDWLTQRTEKAGIQPWDLILEITESRSMRRPQIVLDNLTRLRLKGFKLAVDDFGTGHASLAQVRDIPFDQFKLDRSFVHDADSDRRVQVMFKSALGLARELDLEVTAEGVETEADWRFLRQHDCHKVQGYFIARPMAGEAVGDWLRVWREKAGQLLFDKGRMDVKTHPKAKAGQHKNQGPVLIVEDNSFQRKVQARIVRDEGFEPHLAIDAQDALKQLQDLEPVLVLIDIEMPGISGLELLRRLRRSKAHAQTPVLVISGINTKTAVHDSMSAGANSFMVKPYSRQTLVDCMQRALASTKIAE